MAFPSTLERKYAPIIAPATPGIINLFANDHWTLPSLKWEIPEAKLVKTWAKCTQALATAGGIPIPNNIEFEETPYAMPRDPSMVWAIKPTNKNHRNISASQLSPPAIKAKNDL